MLAIRAFNAAFAGRVRAARDQLSKRLGREVTQREMAERLANAAACTVSADTYGKYEDSSQPVLMPLRLLYYFAELTGTTLEALLAPVPYPGCESYQVSANDLRKYEKGIVPIPHHLLFGLSVALDTPLEELLAPADPRDAAMATGAAVH